MQNRITTFLRWCFLVWGGLSLFAVIAFVVSAVVHSIPSKDDAASIGDVRFVLILCELGDQRIEKVVHSCVSVRSFTGDYLDAYAIKISHVDVAELNKQINANSGRWYRGDQLPKALDDAVAFTGAWLHPVPWFPKPAELRTGEFCVYPWSIYLHDMEPLSIELIFVRPSDNMVFFFGAKV